jgi:metal-responsive CopG/Arc/MetJ family transcriptional regulator
MKTAVSIPNDLYAEAERLAQRLNTSRSRLYTAAVREYLARHDPEAVTEALNRVCDLVDSRADPAVAAAGRRLLEHVEW